MRLNDLINQELGRYRVEALLGRGGMAAVYRAFDTRLHRHIALKVLYPQYLEDADIVERFRREAVTAAQLDHPHIAPIYDVGEADGLVFLAMKLLPGPSLAEVLQREQRLPSERIVQLTCEIAAALDEAHRRGIIHRDIKPGNILFDERGRAILTDFGIAKSLDAPALTESSVIVGTPDYIAPEQIDPRMASGGKLDYRADLYSLGALLYRALTGRRPFDGPSQVVLLAHLQTMPEPPSTIVPSLPPALDAVIAKAMAKRPADRYNSATELAQALAESFGDATEVGTIFPPTAIRGDAHTLPTPEVGNRTAAVAASIEPPVSERSRRRIAGPLIVAALGVLLMTALLTPTARAVWSRFSDRTDVPVIAAAPATTPASTATTTATRTATTTTIATGTASPTAQPSATSTSQPGPLPPAPTTAPPTPRPASGQSSAPRPPVVAPTRAPVPQPTRAPAPKPTSAPPQPTATAALPRCAIALVGGFGNLWRTNPAVRAALGCPTGEEQAGYSVEQMFEGGRMYWRQQGDQFWVFNGDMSGSWRKYLDVSPGDPDPTDQPPSGFYAPAGGFGKLWQKYPTIRKALGWGVTPQTPGTGVIQPFEGGLMLFVPGMNDHGKQIYVLDNNGAFNVFADTYVGP